jgi:hypothetical protein
VLVFCFLYLVATNDLIKWTTILHSWGQYFHLLADDVRTAVLILMLLPIGQDHSNLIVDWGISKLVPAIQSTYMVYIWFLLDYGAVTPLVLSMH